VRNVAEALAGSVRGATASGHDGRGRTSGNLWGALWRLHPPFHGAASAPNNCAGEWAIPEWFPIVAGTFMHWSVDALARVLAAGAAW